MVHLVGDYRLGAVIILLHDGGSRCLLDNHSLIHELHLPGFLVFKDNCAVLLAVAILHDRQSLDLTACLNLHELHLGLSEGGPHLVEIVEGLLGFGIR